MRMLLGWMLGVAMLAGDAGAETLRPPGLGVPCPGRPPSDSFPECRGNPGQDLAMQATAIVVRNGVDHVRLEDVARDPRVL